MTERYTPEDDPIPSWDDERDRLFQEFYRQPAVIDAQARADARAKELLPLKEFYNNEITKQQLRFQQETHVEMLALTDKLRKLDERYGRASVEGVPDV